MLAIRVITTHPTAVIYHRTIYVILIQSLSLSPLSSCCHTQDTDARRAYSTEINGWGKRGKTGDFVEKFHLEKYCKKN